MNVLMLPRLAVGGRGRDVLRQFLLEAVLLALAGGGLGLILGFAGSELISRWFQWPTRVSSGAVLLAFGFSSAIGLFFGYYPARRAARLDPIDALRHE